MVKLTNAVLDFTADSTERRAGYESFVEYYETYKAGKTSNDAGVSFAEMNKTMLQLFTDEIERLSGKKLAEYTDAVQYFSFPDVRQATFTVVGMLTDLIIPDSLVKNLGMIAEIRNGGWGESLKVELQPRDLFVVSKNGRNRRKADIKRYFRGEVSIMPEPRSITVGISLYDVLTGKYTLAEMVSRAAQSLEVEVARDIYFSFAKAMDALPTTGTNSLAVNGWSTEGFVKLVQKIEAWNGGAKAVAIGTKLALSKVLPESTNSRIIIGNDQALVTVGYLRDYYGTTLMEINQIADYTVEFGVLFPDDRIYIICPGVDKPVKVFFEGSTMANIEDGYSHANLLQTGTLYKSWGVGVATSALAGMIKLS